MRHDHVPAVTVKNPRHEHLHHLAVLLLLLEAVEHLIRLVCPHAVLREQVFDNDLVLLEVFFFVVLKQTCDDAIKLLR